MKFNVGMSIHARFKLVVSNASGEVTRETGWFNNLVLDAGLAQMSKGDWFTNCNVGTDGTEPKVTDTKLLAHRATTTTVESRTFGADLEAGYRWTKIRWRFPQGAASGNLAEVGCGWVAYPDNLCWNRALIKDASGDPTTITVLGDEFLDVYTEVRVYAFKKYAGSFKLLDKTGGLISEHTTTVYPLLDVSAVQGMGRISFEAAVSNTCFKVSAKPVVDDLVTKDDRGIDMKRFGANRYPTPTSLSTTGRWGLNEGNGVKVIQVWSWLSGLIGGWNGAVGCKVAIDPPISKNNTQTLDVTLEATWTRHVEE